MGRPRNPAAGCRGSVGAIGRRRRGARARSRGRRRCRTSSGTRRPGRGGQPGRHRDVAVAPRRQVFDQLQRRGLGRGDQDGLWKTVCGGGRGRLRRSQGGRGDGQGRGHAGDRHHGERVFGVFQRSARVVARRRADHRAGSEATAANARSTHDRNSASLANPSKSTRTYPTGRRPPRSSGRTWGSLRAAA